MDAADAIARAKAIAARLAGTGATADFSASSSSAPPASSDVSSMLDAALSGGQNGGGLSVRF